MVMACLSLDLQIQIGSQGLGCSFVKFTLHVGMGKAGSTALQKFLGEEAAFLKDHRCFYLGRLLKRIPGGDWGATQTEVAKSSTMVTALEALEEYAATPNFRKDFDHIIWSNEVLAMSPNPVRQIDALAAFFEKSTLFTSVEIVLVFRRQDDWLESAYRQWALQNKLQPGYAVLTPEQYAEREARLLDYHAIYTAWSAKLPVRVVTFDEVKAKGGVVEYFAELWGLNGVPEPQNYQRIRPAIGPALSALYSAFNRSYPVRMHARTAKQFVEKYRLPELSGEGQVCIPIETRAQVLARYSNSNDALAHALGRDSLFPPPTDMPLDLYTNTTEDMISYLVRIAKAQSSEIDRLRSRIIALEKSATPSRSEPPNED